MLQKKKNKKKKLLTTSCFSILPTKTSTRYGRVYAVTHRNDLEELLPDNEVLADQV